MIDNALRHLCDALDYPCLLRNQSVFDFVVILAAMAQSVLYELQYV